MCPVASCHYCCVCCTEQQSKPSCSDPERYDTSSVPSSSSAPGSASGSGANSLQGSGASSPCSSPQLLLLGAPDAASGTPMGDGGKGAGGCCYVVMKANSHRLLDISQQRGLWATSPVNEKKLNKAFLVGPVCKLYLLFYISVSFKKHIIQVLLAVS